MPDPRQLWADPAAREPHRGWFQRPPAPLRPVPPDADPPPPGRSRWLTGLYIGLALLALAVAGVVGALLARGDQKKTPAARPVAAAALPAGRIAAISAALAPGVVQVRSSLGSGAGFVFRDSGTIVTTAHLVAGAKRVQVVFEDPDHPVSAQVLGSDRASDLAALKVSAADAPRLRTLSLGDSDAVKVGDPALTIGYPRGLGRTVGAGIISGFGTAVSGPQGFHADKVIQTDAPVDAGDAGGPLLNAKGQVIGVSTRITPTGGAATGGIGLAIPSNTVNQIVPQLEARQTVSRPLLGVSAADSPTGDGALVQDVVPGSPADRAGLQGAASTGGLGGTGGDTILGIDTTRIHSADDVVTAVGKHQPGDVVSLLVERAGQRFNLDVTLEKRPAGSP